MQANVNMGSGQDIMRGGGGIRNRFSTGAPRARTRQQRSTQYQGESLHCDHHCYPKRWYCLISCIVNMVWLYYRRVFDVLLTYC